MSNTRLPSGIVTEDPAEIKSHVRDFYKDIYTQVPTDECALNTLLLYLPTLHPRDSEDLDTPLTPEEIDVAAKQLGKNKTFWPILKDDLLSVLNYAIACRSLPFSFHRAVISLIPQNGDLSDIANWRPVSLLNTDYKMFACEQT